LLKEHKLLLSVFVCAQSFRENGIYVKADVKNLKSLGTLVRVAFSRWFTPHMLGNFVRANHGIPRATDAIPTRDASK
jgi:hypothetical protein